MVLSNTYTVNTVGNVTISVKDANGCTYTVPSNDRAPLNPPTALTLRKRILLLVIQPN
jgi:hypothetical protein